MATDTEAQTFLVRESAQDKKRRHQKLLTLKKKIFWAKIRNDWDEVERLQHEINTLHG